GVAVSPFSVRRGTGARPRGIVQGDGDVRPRLGEQRPGTCPPARPRRVAAAPGERRGVPRRGPPGRLPRAPRGPEPGRRSHPRRVRVPPATGPAAAPGRLAGAVPAVAGTAAPAIPAPRPTLLPRADQPGTAARAGGRARLVPARADHH